MVLSLLAPVMRGMGTQKVMETDAECQDTISSTNSQSVLQGASASELLGVPTTRCQTYTVRISGHLHFDKGLKNPSTHTKDGDPLDYSKRNLPIKVMGEVGRKRFKAKWLLCENCFNILMPPIRLVFLA